MYEKKVFNFWDSEYGALLDFCTRVAIFFFRTHNPKNTCHTAGIFTY
jgi:hypothetical protein